MSDVQIYARMVQARRDNHHALYVACFLALNGRTDAKARARQYLQEKLP